MQIYGLSYGPNEWHLGNLHQPWEVWGPTPDTLTKIHASCRSQEGPEEANLFTPTSQLLLKIKQTCQLDRIHGLTAVSVPAFFPSSSKNDECWWGTRDPSTVYVWDSMEDQDKQSSMEALRDTENWVIWKPNLDTRTEDSEGGLSPASLPWQRHWSEQLGV